MSNNKFKFKNKGYKSVRVGGWLFEWFLDEKHPERSFMRVLGESGLFDLKIKANSHVFGYLLAAAEQNKLEQLHGWITLVYIPAMAMTQDQGLTNDIQHAIGEWMKRREAEGKEAAKKVTPEQEAANQAYMESVVEYANATPKEREQIRREGKEIMREIIQKEGDNGIDK